LCPSFFHEAHMISLEEAKKQAFENATIPELRKYCEQAGIEFAPADSGPVLRKRLRANFGITSASQQFAAPRKKAKAKSEIFPPYNLTTDGIWGGRRHRIRLPRPPGVKEGVAELFGWNGKHPYPIKYDEVDLVPEPILNILKDKKTPRPLRVDRGNGEVTTAWEFSDANFSYLGIDEDTKDRAGSLTEWYQGKGVKWFQERTLADLQAIARLIELSQLGDDRKPLDRENLLGKLCLFFFGFSDPEEMAA
jgi:hypothetical protein